MRTLAALVALAAGLAGCGFQAPTVGEDGQPITVGFLATASLQDEASGAVTIPVGLNGPTDELVSVRYRFTGGTAMNGADYVGSDNTLTIPPGATEAKIPLTINMDGEEEQAETIKLELSDPVGALLGTSSHTVTISRDILPRVKFESGSSQADEATSPVLRVSLDVPSEIEVTVDYVVTGTATSADYTFPPGKLTFPPGTMSKDLQVPVTDDALDEFDEDFLVTLTSSTNVVVGNVASHDHMIIDNDAEPTVSFMQATQSRQENGLVVTLTVKLSAPSGKTVKVDVMPGSPVATDPATNGTDYIFAPTQLKFDPGVTTQTTTIVIVDDNTDEFDEDFTAVLSVSPGYNATLGAITTDTITITDEDNPPTVEFADNSVVVNEGDSGTTPVNFDVQLSRASAKPITIPISVTSIDASLNGDYTVTGNPITIAPGQTTGRITINVVGDTVRENTSNGTEDVFLTIPGTGLTNVTRGGNNTVKFVTIKDDD